MCMWVHVSVLQIFYREELEFGGHIKMIVQVISSRIFLLFTLESSKLSIVFLYFLFTPITCTDSIPPISIMFLVI